MVAEGVWMDNCAIGFPNLLEIFSRIELRPDGCTSVARNFHIKA
jgi:hypothetical protein